MTGFAYHRRGKQIAATFSGFEADLLRSLASQLIELLHDEASLPQQTSDPLEALLDFSGPTTEPEDPVLARLFPTAYRDDEEAAGEFRRFTEGSLRESKAAGASSIVEALEEAGLPPELLEDGLMIDVELDAAEAETWMRSFTDLRLALATRLDIEEGDEDYWDQLSEEDPRSQVYGIYQWLGYLQETLVESLVRAA
ncbi:DUF2017 domain-containing protein [Nocardioides sp. Iso805N]|uniref:DUF2017 domain-containing protein n=1 Tax=Nocardioides sp. Iso805N TaxID=1283287 RepID=UPI000360532D|nr:DUF2017 domain-containing protein [Nocardioides sp. Iso805N]